MDELRERIARAAFETYAANEMAQHWARDFSWPRLVELAASKAEPDNVAARVVNLALSEADAILAEIGRTHAVVPKEMPNATAWAICQEADICGSDPCGKCPAEEICHGEPSIRGCRLMARNAYRAALKAATPPASTGGGEGG